MKKIVEKILRKWFLPLWFRGEGVYGCKLVENWEESSRACPWIRLILRFYSIVIEGEMEDCLIEREGVTPVWLLWDTWEEVEAEPRLIILRRELK